jgi:anti-repressor protein
MEGNRALQVFRYGIDEVRVVDCDGEPWWVLRDVCDVLGLDNVGMVADRLDDDELTSIKLMSGGQNREMYVISESGLYNVILRSDKPEAKAFRRWVTQEVLPSIRKHGGYFAGQESSSKEEIAAKGWLAMQSIIEERELKIAEQREAIEIMRPNVDFAIALATSETSILVRDFAKILRQNGIDIGEKRLYARFREDGYLCKYGESYNRPTQRSMDMGLFEVKTSSVTTGSGTVRLTLTTKVTVKGQRYFLEKFLAEAREGRVV